MQAVTTLTKLHGHTYSRTRNNFEANNAAEGRALADREEESGAESHEERPCDQEWRVPASLADEDADDRARDDEREDQTEKIQTGFGRRVVPDDLEADRKVVRRDDHDPSCSDLREGNGGEAWVAEKASYDHGTVALVHLPRNGDQGEDTAENQALEV